ncbi:MAG: MFS transporter [Methanothrix sp.]|jgi:Arabinose efflux permease|uniref:Major facilitator superfamily MFS_1 n=1 Tax=Methanothrix thermoacetophila (strain DSM 6194 / JCM 14653 / NBRC 101360 / PT) TaxID=349307 RepID=A0B6G9_METTP|nr:MULTISPECIES: MFS transporter [Methanothrix]ABK14293.1 major facilitator superfamily MFS_1 [Methanothrix thermoacetophila PT]MBC7080479.1 MFS transporter [Methanothrix sp.]NPU87680.1 MFS transporter [Methanothrix sp.]
MADLPKSIFPLYLSVFVSVLGFAVVAPIFPLYVLDMGATHLMLGMIISIYGAVQLLTQMPAGRLSDQRGRKPVLLIGLLTFTIMPLLYIYASNAYQLLLIRIFGGIGASMVWPVTMALIVDCVDPSHRGLAMGWYNASFYSAVAVGPVIGSLLYGSFGINAPFIFWSLFAVASLIMVTFVVREPPVRGEVLSTNTPRTPKARLIVDGSMITFIICCSVVMVPGIIGGFNMTLLPELALSVGVGVSQLGILYMAYAGSNALANIYFGRVADLGHRRLLISGGSLGCVLGFLVLGHGQGILPQLIALTILGLSSGICTPAATVVVSYITSPERRGEIFGIFNTSRMLGVVIGPIIAGLTADLGGLAGAITAFLAVSLLISAMTLSLREI